MPFRKSSGWPIRTATAGKLYAVLEDIERKADAEMTCCQPKAEAAGQGADEKSRGVAACC